MATLFPSFRCTFSSRQTKSSSGLQCQCYRKKWKYKFTTNNLFYILAVKLSIWKEEASTVSDQVNLTIYPLNLKVFSGKIFLRFIRRKSWWLTWKAFHWLIYFRFVWSKINRGWPDRLSDRKLTKPCHEISKIRRKENNINEFLSSWR